jgi:hypothetical protein
MRFHCCSLSTLRMSTSIRTSRSKSFPSSGLAQFSCEALHFGAAQLGALDLCAQCHLSLFHVRAGVDEAIGRHAKDLIQAILLIERQLKLFHDGFAAPPFSRWKVLRLCGESG